MSGEIIRMKGTRTGLELSFAEGVSFPRIETEIISRLESIEGNFFTRGTEVSIRNGTFPGDQMARLKKIFNQHGLRFSVAEKVEKNIDLPMEKSPDKVPEEEKMIVVNHTLRGGQEIRAKGSVMVFGNVNPGAQIIAGGNIDIRGTCRGIVHAGAFGDVNAFVVADHLIPLQIRIADFFSRSPDDLDPAELNVKSNYPERASVKDGQIVVEPIKR
ncbi:MAG: septum site-determining protein MinC [Selenomonadaceae bacterium]|nr:septum site-determining protein MinC [Selenomonadaceae bacterium]